MNMKDIMDVIVMKVSKVHIVIFPYVQITVISMENVQELQNVNAMMDLWVIPVKLIVDVMTMVYVTNKHNSVNVKKDLYMMRNYISVFSIVNVDTLVKNVQLLVNVKAYLNVLTVYLYMMNASVILDLLEEVVMKQQIFILIKTPLLELMQVV